MMALDAFFYDGNDNVENMSMYKPGGYHPVLLGDILPKRSESREPRYRIMQKLGHGAFATVWLARDLHDQFGYVAVKINVSRITGKNNEVGTLRWLRDSKLCPPAYQHVIQLLDDFTIQGPNGTHDCLVTEVVAGMNDFRSLISARARSSTWRYDYPHFHGHNLHLGNLAVSLPQLQEHSMEAIMEHFSNPECIPVVARNVSTQNDSLPAYLVPSVSMVDYLTEKNSLPVNGPVCLKIMDFGNSFREGDERPPSNTPISIRAPEVTFFELSGGEVGSDWNKPIDVWAVACTLYELNFGNVMLYGMGRGDWIIYKTLQLAGPAPPAWQPFWNLEKFCETTGESSVINPDAFWANRRGWRTRDTHLDIDLTEDTDLLIDLLRKMLKTNPEERLLMKDVLLHPWFLK